jgi:NAD(P)-dependent dehydrogenase (short-subunit alcohol dehydrogenase family)
VVNDFEGRWVVVTGGAGVLGAAVVEHVLREGGRVRIPVRDLQAAEELPFARDPRVHIAGPVDLADQESVDRFFDFDASGGDLWASIHVAGGFEMGPIESTDGEVFDRMLRNNARSTFLCCRAAIRKLRARRGGVAGRIVNVSARPALFPELAMHKVAYVASKAAVAAMTQALAAEVADEGIWVNAVLPDIIDTPANRAAMPDARHDRWARPADIATTIAFLASPSNGSTSAALVPVYSRG